MKTLFALLLLIPSLGWGLTFNNETHFYSDSDWNIEFIPAGQHTNKNPKYVTFHYENDDKFIRITHIPGDMTGATKSDFKNGRERSEIRTPVDNGLIRNSEYSLSLKVRFKTFVKGKIYFMQVHNNDKGSCPKQKVPIKIKLIDGMNTIYISPRNVNPYYADAKGLIKVNKWNKVRMDFTTYKQGKINFYLNGVHIAKDIPMTVEHECARMKIKIGVYKELSQDKHNKYEKNIIDYDDIILKKNK